MSMALSCSISDHRRFRCSGAAKSALSQGRASIHGNSTNLPAESQCQNGLAEAGLRGRTDNPAFPVAVDAEPRGIRMIEPHQQIAVQARRLQAQIEVRSPSGHFGHQHRRSCQRKRPFRPGRQRLVETAAAGRLHQPVAPAGAWRRKSSHQRRQPKIEMTR